MRLERGTESTAMSRRGHGPGNAQGHHPRAPDSRRQRGGRPLAELALASPPSSASSPALQPWETGKSLIFPEPHDNPAKQIFCSHFTQEEIETQRGKIA